MGISKESIQLDVKIGGQQAGQTLNQLQKESKSLNAQIRNLTPGTKKFTDTAAKLKKVNGDMKKLKGEVYGVQKSQAALNAQNLRNIESTGLYSTQLSLLRNGFLAAKSGALLFIGTLKTVRGALIATGIGAFVVIFASLVSYFTQTKRGVDLLNSVSAALGATWAVLIDRASAIGETVIKMFTDPKQALLDFGQLLLDQVINRFKAIGVVGKGIVKILNGEFKEGFKELGEGTLQLATGVEDVTGKMKSFGESIAGVAKEIKNETGAAFQLEQQLAKLRDRQIQLTVERAKTRNEIEKLKFAARDLENSAEERLAFLQKAGKLEQEIIAKEIAAATEAVAIQEQQMALGENMLEDEQKLADLKVTLEQIEQKSWKVRRTLKMEEITVNNELAAQEKKRITDKKIAAEEEVLAKQEEDAAALERETANAAMLAEIKQENELARLSDASDIALREVEIEKAKELGKVKESENAEELKSEIVKKHENKKLEIIEEAAERERQIRQMQVSATLSTAGAMFATLAEYQNNGSESWKQLKIAEAVVTGSQAAINAYNAVVGVPVLGPVLAPVAAATAVAATSAKINEIRNTKIPKAEAPKGYFFGGYTPSSGSNSDAVGVVHANEYVIPANMVRDPQYADTLSLLENDRVARNGYQNGGNVTNTSAAATSAAPSASNSELTSAIKTLNEILGTGIEAVYGDEQIDIIKERIDENQDAEDQVKALA